MRRAMSREVHDMLALWRRGLAESAARRGDRIVERHHQRWIAFRSERQRRAFAEVRPSRRRVQVFLLPALNELRDPLRVGRNAPTSQGWNWFRTKLTVVGNGRAYAALALLRQSYEIGPRRPRLRAAQPGRTRQSRLPLGSR